MSSTKQRENLVNLINCLTLISVGTHGFKVKSASPKLNIANFVTQDYSHILLVYFVGVFCCSHPYKNVILS